MNTLDLILAGAPTSGVYRVATRSSAQEIMRQAARRGWHGGYLSGRSIVDKASFLHAGARALAFPAYFGHNWDAFEECLTDLNWLHCTGSLLIYDEPLHFAGNSPREWQTALAILQQSADAWRQQQKPFYVLLRKTHGAAPEIPLVVTLMSRQEHPIPDSYWVGAGRFLAGEYPGARSDADATAKLNRLLDAGVTHIIDLTEAGEYGLRPYAAMVQQLGALRGRRITHQRFPIRDMSAASALTMRAILDAIDAAIHQGETIYVHCFGGIGRTGSVVGCYLVQQGMSGESALEEIARRRVDTPDGWRRSPETDEQRELVRGWGVKGEE